jgi:acetoin utilization deacetylase AcuC-like enzyme
VAQRLRALNLPMVLVQEGGYNTEALGNNVVTFLQPFAE